MVLDELAHAVGKLSAVRKCCTAVGRSGATTVLKGESKVS